MCRNKLLHKGSFLFLFFTRRQKSGFAIYFYEEGHAFRKNAHNAVTLMRSGATVRGELPFCPLGNRALNRTKEVKHPIENLNKLKVGL